MRIDQLDGLVAFKYVAESRSFTAAAARLDVSPQAISQTIKGLEARLGVRLFHRTTRSVSLSEAGERLWSRLGPALLALVEATEAAQELHDKPVGQLRIGISRPAFAAWLQPVLAEFHRTYPGISLELCFDDGFVDIVSEGLDAGVRLGDAVAPEMISVPVSAQEPIAIVAAPEYLRRRGVPVRIEDLSGHDCIRFRFPKGGNVFRWELIDNGQLTEMEVQGPVLVNDTAAMIDCALAGVGIAYVIEGVARKWLEAGALVRVLEFAAPVLPGFHLYYPSRRQLPAKLRCMIDFISERLRPRRPREG